MKKILLAFDGQHFSEAVFDFARQLNEQQPIWVTGIFLPSIDYIELLYSYGNIFAGPMYVTEVVQQDDEVLRGNITRFKDLCEAHNISFDIPADYSTHVIEKLTEETRFADMLVLSGKSFYENLGDTREEYIADVLHSAECPVILIPEKYITPDNIVIAYDGSAQSVFAIKQFTYLLPQFKGTKTLIAFFDTTSRNIPDHEHIRKFARLHFDNVLVLNLSIDVKKDMEMWLEEHGNTLLVAGAHSRSILSEIFRSSFIDEAVHRHKVPVFVAHK